MQWIKATDRMPEDWDSVSAIRDTKNGGVIPTDFIYKVHTETLNGIELDNSMWRGKGFIEMEDVEWLDETEWQPMDAAPKDGTEILITEVTEEICIGFCKRGSWYYNNLTDEDGRYVLITHPIGWQPLPKPMKS